MVKRRVKTKLKSIEKRLKAVEQSVEVKHLDRQVTLAGSSPVPLTTGGGWACHSILDRIAQGDGSSQRQGIEIKLKSIVIRGILASSDSTNMVRIMLVQTKNNNQNNANFASGVLNEIAGDADDSILDETTNNEYLLWLYAKDSKVQFKVLYDKLHIVANNNGIDTLVPTSSQPRAHQAPPLKKVNMKFTKGFLNRGIVEYSEEAGVINPVDGDIFLCVESDSTPATIHPQFYVNYRITYTG